MDEPANFDPYLMWLGIRHPERPPNYYRMLGVELFESDFDVIAMAADRQMAHVRRFQNGDRSQLSQQILNELAAARVCLLRPADKEAYDTLLRNSQALQSLETRGRSANESNESANAPPVWVKLQREAYWRRRGIQALVATMAIATLGMTYFGLQLRESQQAARKDQNTQRSTTPPSSATPFDETTKAELEVMADPSSHTTSAELVDGNAVPSDVSSEPHQPTSHVPLPAARENQAPESANQRKKSRFKDVEEPAAAQPPGPSAGKPGASVSSSPSDFLLSTRPRNRLRSHRLTVSGKDGTSTYSRLRAAIENRNIEVAWEEWRALRAATKSFEQKEGVDRIRVLLFQLERFWKAVDSGLAMLKGGMTLQVQNQQIKIVAIDADRVVVEFGGKSQTIDRDHHKMDASFACLMVTLYISSQGGASQPLVAAFLEVDAQSDKEAAKQLRQDTSYRGFHSL